MCVAAWWQVLEGVAARGGGAVPQHADHEPRPPLQRAEPRGRDGVALGGDAPDRRAPAAHRRGVRVGRQLDGRAARRGHLRQGRHNVLPGPDRCGERGRHIPHPVRRRRCGRVDGEEGCTARVRRSRPGTRLGPHTPAGVGLLAVAAVSPFIHPAPPLAAARSSHPSARRVRPPTLPRSLAASPSSSIAPSICVATIWGMGARAATPSTAS